MAYSHEELTIWSIASMTKFFKERDFGVPVEIKQQSLEKDAKVPNKLEIIFDGPDFSRSGTKNERHGVIHVKIFIHTTYVPTDIYAHLRLKAKVADAMSQEITLYRMGAATYNMMMVGTLAPLKTESLRITTVSVEEPDGSLVEGTYCIKLC